MVRAILPCCSAGLDVTDSISALDGPERVDSDSEGGVLPPDCDPEAL